MLTKKKKLEMSIEDAIVYYNSSSDNGFKQLLEDTFGKGFWKPKLITDKVNNIKTLFDHAHFELPYDLDSKNQFERYVNACVILAKVAECYNEGTVLDWNNINQYKYKPYKYSSGGRLIVGSDGLWGALHGSAFTYYKSSELSTASYNNFKDIWEDYWSFK